MASYDIKQNTQKGNGRDRRWIEAVPEPLERAKLAWWPLDPELTWPARRKILVRPTWYLSSSPTIVSRMSLATSRASQVILTTIEP